MSPAPGLLFGLQDFSDRLLDRLDALILDDLIKEGEELVPKSGKDRTPDSLSVPLRFPGLFTNRRYNPTNMPVDQHREISSSESVNEPLPTEFVVTAV